MSKGYQLLEPFDVAGMTRWSKNEIVSIALLEWLVAELVSELGDQLAGVELEVIHAKYVGGPYPTIGAHYRIERDDVGPLILETISRLLRERRALDFVNFVANSPIDWHAAARRSRAPYEDE